jgi:Na+-translocating ferredoxin:NAD+ oxidoreductase RNF subunit RnfB
VDLILIAKAVGALTVIGLVTAVILATAAKRFHVEVDPRVQEVFDALPGSNCGACGNPSCFAVAEGIAVGDLEVTACVAGGQSCASAIATIMGADSCEMLTVVSARQCGGGTKAVRVYEYSGVTSCAAAHKLAGGPLGCMWGCIGLGDCMAACPFDAIRMDERGLPQIDQAKCTGCGICVRECPRGEAGLLMLVPDEAPIVVRCNAHDRAKARKANCPMCCIACKKCERECPHDAIHVIDGNAVVDWEKCIGCLTCVEVCPQKCIDVHHVAGYDPLAVDGHGPAVLPQAAAETVVS